MSEYTTVQDLTAELATFATKVAGFTIHGEDYVHPRNLEALLYGLVEEARAIVGIRVWPKLVVKEFGVNYFKAWSVGRTDAETLDFVDYIGSEEVAWSVVQRVKGNEEVWLNVGEPSVVCYTNGPHPKTGH